MIINPNHIPDLGINFNRLMQADNNWYSIDNHSEYCAQNDVFFVSLRHEDAMDSVINHINGDVLNHIRMGKVLLGIDFYKESRAKIIDNLYKFCDRNDIDTDHVLLIGASPDLKNLVTKPIKLETYHCWERRTKTLVKVENVRGIDPLRNTKHKKTYINLNHIFRAHRAYIMQRLIDTGLQEYGYNSFHNAPETEELEFYSKRYPNLQIPPSLYIDYRDDRAKISGDHTRADITKRMHTLKPHVQNTILYLIGETLFYNEPRFLTEKTFKAIAYKLPFIMIGQPFNLEHLRSLGYKTFDGIIDESYDTITDHNTRLDKILSEIERICSFNEQQKKSFCDSCLDIVDYNYNLLVNKTHYTKTIL